MALMMVVGAGVAPSRSAAADQLGVAVTDIDADYGVVPIDPDRDVYAVRVRADRLPSENDETKPYRGPYSDPKIAPFGGPDSF